MLFFSFNPARECTDDNGQEELEEGEEGQERRVEAHACGVLQPHPLVRAARCANRARQKCLLAHVETQKAPAHETAPRRRTVVGLQGAGCSRASAGLRA